MLWRWPAGGAKAEPGWSPHPDLDRANAREGRGLRSKKAFEVPGLQGFPEEDCCRRFEVGLSGDRSVCFCHPNKRLGFGAGKDATGLSRNFQGDAKGSESRCWKGLQGPRLSGPN